MFSFLSKAVTSLFGSSDNGKGIVTQVANVVDRFNPSDTTLHTMSLEDQKAGDESQKNAQAFVPAPSHESWLDIFIDAFNRIQRPAWSTWALGGLCGWWNLPVTTEIDPFVVNVIWTIVGFWFGSRMIFKDIPNAFMQFRKLVKK